MQKITPCLWLDNNADEALKFYLSMFKDSKILEAAYYGEGGPQPKGTLMTATFLLQGQQFMILNGGPAFKFTEAVSFMVQVDTQEELNELWNQLLSDGGKKQQCGWLKDKYGLSWQIIPSILGQYMKDKDPIKAGRVMQAMLKMDKIIIQDLQAAYQK